MKHSKLILGFLALAAVATGVRAEDKVPLKLTLPKPMFVGTPVPVKLSNLETPRTGKRPDFMVPKGVENFALNKTVTSSDMEPVLGDLAQVTDGEKGGDEGNFVELGKGKQWVQIDLGQPASIYAVAVWHYHSQARVYKAMAVQLSDDPEFKTGVETVYNNDDKNVNGFGAGKDLTYIETNEGRIIDAKGIKARYVRLYSNGNTTSDMNHYIEVEVWGLPAQ
jgi:F5/8 type C domain